MESAPFGTTNVTWHDRTWHDVTWHDVTQRGMTWHDMTRHYVTRRDMAGRDMTWHSVIYDVTWRDMTWQDVTWRDLARHGVVWRDMTWHDVKWRGMTWRDKMWQGVKGRDMTWHDVAWRGRTWHHVTWQDVTWRDMAWYNVTWQDRTWHDMTWLDRTWQDVTWRDVTWRDMTWHDVTWRDMTIQLAMKHWSFDRPASFAWLLINLEHSCQGTNVWVTTKTPRTGSWPEFRGPSNMVAHWNVSNGFPDLKNINSEEISKIYKTQSPVPPSTCWTGSLPGFSRSPKHGSSVEISAMDSLISKIRIVKKFQKSIRHIHQYLRVRLEPEVYLDFRGHPNLVAL